MNSTPAHYSRPLDLGGLALATFLCVLWGFNQVAIKLAIHDIPPLMQCAIRTTLAIPIVLAWMRWRGLPVLDRDGTLWPGIAAGVLFGLEFLFIYHGLLYTAASRATLFVYLAPFFVVLGARIVLPGDRFGVMQWVGLALSFAGMMLAFGAPTPSADPQQIVGDLMMVAAALFWALTTLVIKASALNRVSPEKTLLYQLVIGVPILAVGVLVFGERVVTTPSALAIGSVVYQTLVAGATFALWFSLIVRFSASRLSAFTFLTPLCGVAAGNLILGEPLTAAFALAVALVATGLVLVNRR